MTNLFTLSDIKGGHGCPFCGKAILNLPCRDHPRHGWRVAVDILPGMGEREINKAVEDSTVLFECQAKGKEDNQ